MTDLPTLRRLFRQMLFVSADAHEGGHYDLAERAFASAMHIANRIEQITGRAFAPVESMERSA